MTSLDDNYISDQKREVKYVCNEYWISKEIFQKCDQLLNKHKFNRNKFDEIANIYNILNSKFSNNDERFLESVKIYIDNEKKQEISNSLKNLF